MMVLKLAGLFLSVAMASAGECTDPKMEEWYVRFLSIRFHSIPLLPFSNTNFLLCADDTCILYPHGT